MIGRWLRAPALHFLVLGALLLTAARRLEGRPARPMPSDEELLTAEAIALGVDRTDEAVKTRLARLGQFVGEDAENEAAVEAEARRLGIDRSDIVVRRHLASIMRLAAGHIRPSEGPTEADLQAYLAAHADAFALPDRWRFTHVYLGRTHDDADVARIVARVRDEGFAPAQAAALGDGFVTGATIGPATADEIDRRFGPGFAARVAAAAPHAWIGPIQSSYGVHLVWIDEHLAGGVPPLDAVRGRVVHHWLREHGAERADERMAALRARAAAD